MNFDDQMLERLCSASHVVVFTGAGMSQESGVPTFRDALIGLWENYDPEMLATPGAFLKDPDLVWGWYEWRRTRVLSVKPNAAHRVVAQMQAKFRKVTVITQNVDDLHERAGSRNVVHLHGSLHCPRCFACAREHTLPDAMAEEPEGGRRIPPPNCIHCGDRVRPGVVWFGESLPSSEWEQAQQAATDCDVFFSVGTSSIVMPAASLPILASQYNAMVIQVNPHSTSHDEVVHFNLRGKAGEVFTALQLAMGWNEENG